MHSSQVRVPPDLQDGAVQTVLQQAEVLSENGRHEMPVIGAGNCIKKVSEILYNGYP